MKLHCGWFLGSLVVVLLLASGTSHALPMNWWDQDYHFCPDPPNDAEGGNSYEVLGIGYALVDQYLVVCVETNFPINGLSGRDSYATNTHFMPGDLYINFGGMFQTGGGTVWGIATTAHSGDQTADPSDNGEPWFSIVDAGDVFYGASFATGTWELYPTGTPSDGNDGDGQNDYPSLLTDYTQGWNIAAGYSGFHYDGNYYYILDLDFVQSTHDGSGGPNVMEAPIQLFWTMECGNDGAEYKIEIPEPSTVALLAAGVAAMAARRRRII